MPYSAEFSDEIVADIEKAKRLRTHYIYQPNAADDLEDKTVIALVSPTGAGKSYLMDEIIRLAPEYQPIGSTTTRPRRSNDPENYKTADEGVTHASMLAAIENGALVNFTVNETGHIYGTSPSDIAEYAVGPILSDSIESFANAGFKEFVPAFLVVDEATYMKRLETERMQFTDIERRLQEGLSSIAFARMNIQEPWLNFIDTGDTPLSLSRAADTLLRAASQHSGPIMTNDYKAQALDGMENAIQNVRRQLP